MSNEPETVTLETTGKPFWASKGIIGAVVALVSIVASRWQWQIDSADLTDIILTVIGILGAILALVGRVKAKSPIVFTGTKPGGKFNPHAEVRRAKPAGPMRGPHGRHRKGFVRLPVLVAAICWLGIAVACVGVMELGRANVYPDVTETPDLGSWIKYREVVDERPFLVRLLASLRPWGEVGTSRMKVSVDDASAEVDGSYQENSQVAKEDVEIQTLGVGISGGADF